MTIFFVSFICLFEFENSVMYSVAATKIQKCGSQQISFGSICFTVLVWRLGIETSYSGDYRTKICPLMCGICYVLTVIK